ncbi:hypothetical protein RBSH_02026 [Rhodopirellula baltica SH28]|uniref:Uncharacterized protein n=1 Tax=Rhodopirellula baltica SH28 TaxID=993517 RepID=K5DIJ9_RHOBT|nr:hypothetical protein RBSH_02026 [Rhodopirellula baltica SH28]
MNHGAGEGEKDSRRCETQTDIKHPEDNGDIRLNRKNQGVPTVRFARVPEPALAANFDIVLSARLAGIIFNRNG